MPKKSNILGEREQELIREAQDPNTEEDRLKKIKKKLRNEYGWGKKKTERLQPRS